MSPTPEQRPSRDIRRAHFKPNPPYKKYAKFEKNDNLISKFDYVHNNFKISDSASGDMPPPRNVPRLKTQLDSTSKSNTDTSSIPRTNQISTSKVSHFQQFRRKFILRVCSFSEFLSHNLKNKCINATVAYTVASVKEDVSFISQLKQKLL